MRVTLCYERWPPGTMATGDSPWDREARRRTVIVRKSVSTEMPNWLANNCLSDVGSRIFEPIIFQPSRPATRVGAADYERRLATGTSVRIENMSGLVQPSEKES
ncbi:hypothetical protein Pla52o_22510 [Novipirellula galeiformis]|uniref:Uncharacterized protein n=1 Tax=Novipirellula galeiformis TaxID=2528004 RepID=A0A5C6CLK4_9BACT|nr:hypothetical protein Pla52o_22510 [Novipirellula galeiformis]